MSAFWGWLTGLFDVRRDDGTVSNGKLGGAGVILSGLLGVFTLVAPLFELDPNTISLVQQIAAALGITSAGVGVKGVRDALDAE